MTIENSDSYAFDKDTVRTKTVDGFMRVEVSNISKAMVCPYYGSEIPVIGFDGKKLALSPDKVYFLFRCPDELAKAASTFNNIPLLNNHVPVNTVDFPKHLISGAMGDDAVFEYPYLKNSLTVWHKADIDGIESREKTELSSAYRYVVDMTPGEFEGQKYDGVMRNLIGNHVAIVERGRAGHDVIVGDKNPFNEVKTMSKQAEAKAKVIEEALAQDADLTPEQRTKIAILLASDEKLFDKEEEKEAVVKKVKKAKKEIAKDEDEEDEDDKKETVDKTAMDAAIAETAKFTEQRITALFQAREDVLPIVGKCALDSAEAVYKHALDHLKISVDGVHPSAFKALVDMAKDKKPVIAQDKKAGRSLGEIMPEFYNLLSGKK